MEQGKWVAVKDRNIQGFILETNFYDAMVYVIQDGKPKGEQKFACHRLVEIATLLKPEEEEELKRLHINMALDTDDKAWLTKLSEAEGSK